MCSRAPLRPHPTNHSRHCGQRWLSGESTHTGNSVCFAVPQSLASLSLSLLLPSLFSFSCLFIQASLSWPIDHPGASLLPSASIQVFWIFVPQDIKLLLLSLSPLCEFCPHYSLPPYVGFFSSTCVKGVLKLCPLCVCAVCPLPRSVWWRGGRVAQVCLLTSGRCSYPLRSIFFIYVHNLAINVSSKMSILWFY